MLNTRFDTIRGRAVAVPGDDIDTDRIIPASFMKVITFDGIGQYAFYGERFDENGYRKNHPLDAPQHQGAAVLISGRNFGCGSSREHAPQALYRFGFRAIIAESFAEIFFGNCTMLGLPCVSVSTEARAALEAFSNQHPDKDIEVDLVNCVVRAGDQSYPFTMKQSALEALREGEWDPLAKLMANQDAIRATAAKLPYLAWNRG